MHIIQVIRHYLGLTQQELARLAGTIPYEIMLGFGTRVTRRVVD